MNIKNVPLEWVNRVWQDVEEYLAAALQHSKGDYTVDQAKALIASGEWSLLVAVEGEEILGAATVSFYNRPNDRVALVTAIGGKAITNTESFKQLKMFAESNGATVIECAARKSMVRLLRHFNFEPKYQIVEARLL